MKSPLILVSVLALALVGDSLAGHRRPRHTVPRTPTVQQLQDMKLPASRKVHPRARLLVTAISVDCQASAELEASANRRRRRNRRPPETKPTDPNQQECMVKLERFHRRLIINYPTPVWTYERTVEFYKGVWDADKKCCKAFVIGRGDVCVPEGETLTEWGF